jgi:drug/metabolite transporter (DMT)-like permease
LRDARAESGGVFYALGSALAFSSLGIWGKLATHHGLATYTVLSWRFGLVALVLMVVAGRGLAMRDRAVLSGTGLMYVASTATYFGALGRISAGTSSLLLYLAPSFVVLYQRLLGRMPTRAQLSALAVTLAGLGLVIGLPGAGDADTLGLALGVATGGLYGAYLLLSERWAGRYAPLASTAHMTLTAAVCFAGAGAATGTLDMPRSAAQWGITLGMIVFPTLLAVPALYIAIRRIGAARTGVLCTFEPLFTVLLAALVLGEPLRPAVLAGGLLILAGALLVQRT